MPQPEDAAALARRLQLIDDAVVELDEQWRFTYLNRAAERLLGLPAGELVGTNVFDVLPGGRGSVFHRAYLAALERDEPVEISAFSQVLRRWFRVRAHPHEGRLTIVLREITDEVRQQLLAEVRERVVKVLEGQHGPTDVLLAMAAELRDITGFELAELWIRDRETRALVLERTEHATDPDVDRFVRETLAVPPMPESASSPDSAPGRALASGAPVISERLAEDPGFRRAQLAAATGMQRAIHLPMTAPATPDAVIGLLSRAPAGADDWLHVLAEIHAELAERLARQREVHDLTQLFTLSRDVLVVGGLDGYFMRVNPALSALLGLDERELLSRPFAEFLHPDDVPATDEAVAHLDGGRPIARFVNRYRTASGDHRILAWSSHPLPAEGVAYGVARDVTDEERDRVLEQSQREVLEAILLGAELETTLDRIARALEERFPGSSATIHLRDAQEDRLRLVAAPSLPASFLDAVRRVRVGQGAGSCGGAAATGELVVTTDVMTDVRWLDDRGFAELHGLRSCWSTPFSDGRGQVLGTLTVYRREVHDPPEDERRIARALASLAGLVVQRSVLRRRLVESEERFRLVAQATSDAIYDWDIANGSVWWNEGIEQLFGHPWAGDGSHVDQWSAEVVEEDRPALLADLQRALADDAGAWNAEYRFRCHDGRIAHVLERGSIVRDAAGRPLRMIGGMVDLTERRQLEQQYLRAQRMESIGALAGGIAHDLNNVLAPIMMAAELLVESGLPDADDELVRTIETSSRRGAEMVRQVLSFARGFDGERRAIDLRELVGDLDRILGDLLLSDIELVLDVPDDVWAVTADATQLQQVLLNLAINARDAMRSGGVLTVRVRNVEVETSVTASGSVGGSCSSLRELGPHVELTVTDTGIGIPGDVRERIFDPFFTTKSETSGTGLGLSTSLAIVRSHGGALDVSSAVGAGTTVTVRLPATPSEVAPPEVQRRFAVQGAGELILVVDDEAAVRAMTQQTLESFGFRVVTAQDGAEALSLYATRSEEVDLIITDVRMPVMGGVAMIHGLRRLDPDVPIIVVSGLTDDGRMPEAREAGASEVLAKPFSTEVLLDAVARTLGLRV